MKYGITLEVRRGPFIELTQTEFEQIKNAKRCLLEHLKIEETFNLLIENFREYEIELYDRGINTLLVKPESWSVVDMSRINRRLGNLLSGCRMYLDSIPHHLNRIYGGRNQNTTDLKATISEQKVAHLEYRIMEQLRNFIQHEGFPVLEMQYPSSRIDHPDGFSIATTVSPIVRLRDLRGSDFDANVLAEMNQLGEKIDLKPIIRTYIECFTKIHTKFRELIKGDVEIWDHTIQNALTRYYNAGGERGFLSVVAVAIDDADAPVEETSIFEHFLEYRKAIEKKHWLPNNLSIKFVTGEVGARMKRDI